MSAHFRNITFFSDHNVITINGKLVVNKRLKGPIGIEIMAEKCSLTNSGSCNSFAPYRVDDFCTGISNPFFGQNTVNRMQPKFGCPIEVADYTMKDLVMDMRILMQVVPYPEIRVHATVKFFQLQSDAKKRHVACFVATVKILNASRGRKAKH